MPGCEAASRSAALVVRRFPANAARNGGTNPRLFQANQHLGSVDRGKPARMLSAFAYLMLSAGFRVFSSTSPFLENVSTPRTAALHRLIPSAFSPAC